MQTDPKPLNAFYPRLACSSDVTKAIKKEFGARAAGILKKMRNDLPFDEENEIGDLVADLLENDHTEDETFYGRGSDGFFPISICSLGGVSFIRASEFDDIGFFGSTHEARSHAEQEYEAYGPFVNDPGSEDEDDFKDDEPEND